MEKFESFYVRPIFLTIISMYQQGLTTLKLIFGSIKLTALIQEGGADPPCYSSNTKKYAAVSHVKIQQLGTITIFVIEC